jgi:HK97 family phage prohead protease
MSAVAEHEARHAAAGLLLGLDLTKASADADGTGRVLPSWDRLDVGDPDIARKAATMIVVGPLGDDGWPPAYPSKGAATKDERQLAVLAEHLGLDEGGWSRLVTEAWRLAGTREFELLEHAIEHLLSQGHVLDERTLNHVKAIASEAGMQHKQVGAVAAATDAGTFSAIAATYSLDRQGDVIVPGAFAKTIEAWRSAGKMIPIAWNHSGEAADIIGYIDPAFMREQEAGLYVEGRLDLENSETAREAWRSMKANSVGLSFGFKSDSRKRADGVTELTNIDLFEISVTATPANFDTRVLAMKTAGQLPDDDELDPSRVRRRRAFMAILGFDQLKSEQRREPSHTELERRLIARGLVAPITERHEDLAERASESGSVTMHDSNGSSSLSDREEKSLGGKPIEISSFPA